MSIKTLVQPGNKSRVALANVHRRGGGIEERQDRRQGVSINSPVTAIIAEPIGAKRAR